jgi:hypothetical protein
VSKREFQTTSVSEGTLRVRRAWTLLDRAYTQCRRALGFLRFEDGDADTLAPSLRRNSGPRSTPTRDLAPASTPSSATPAEPKVPVMPVKAPANGGASSPFMPKS